MALGKGIPVINGFDLNSKLPLDSRAVADTTEEMNALVTNGSVGDGQLCYCKADKKLYVLKDGVWSEVGGGGGGASVPPTLWLVDINNYTIRTTITEEEYNNLKNGLYNQIMYCSSVDQINLIALYNPSKLFGFGSEEDGYRFSFAYFVYNESLEISGLNQCFLSIGEKNANNEYPFTVEDNGTASLSGTVPIYEATYDSTSNKLTLKKAVSGSPNILFVKYTNNNGDYYTWLCFTKTLNISDSFGWQCIDYGRNKIHTITANDTSIETVDQGLGQTTTLFNKEILVPPSSGVTPLLPCTTADNGKVLSVVNGEAQWASAGGSGSISVTFED